ncbi:glycosyltransferase family 4 protein [Tenacibaculum sp. SG-28]|uniref:glycosyltransferase family 4 protein n=1 Tax=Tenacibaculum sp. SG-28 TaxID=754426 RepID=UPI000CF378DE|nr:glycosyltransferase family 4 protein [Tenacibaculum sp. SG-28]PQJ23046.1 glycosyl transferase [Tenacibaculum sp. SG-28]
MRIGMILDNVFPPDPRVENEAIELIRGGNEVFLFCLTYSESEAEKTVEINGISVVRYLSNQLEYKLSALAYTVPFYTWSMQKKIKHFIKKYTIQALHIHDIKIAQATFNANKNFDLPVVLDLHDNYPEVMKFYPHLQTFPGKYIISPKKWKQKEEAFIHLADKVITVSKEFVNDLLHRITMDKDKVVLVPNTIRSSFFTDYTVDEEIVKRYQGKFMLLYLGDTHLRRGLLTAIRSLQYLTAPIPAIKLVIVGKSTTDTVLKREVATLGLEEYVDFEGWKDVALFQSYIEASSLCISPLRRNLQHDVAYANKLFQYMSLGKPLLVSDAIAQRDLVERISSGLVHQEKNPEDFAEKVLQLYTNKDLQIELGNNGRSFVRNEFTWDKTAKGLIALYKDL